MKCQKKNEIWIKLIFFLLIINIFFDISTNIILNKSTTNAIIRAFLIYFVLFIIYINNRKALKVNIYIWLLLLHTLMLLPFSNNSIFATQNILKTFASILLFPISLYVLNTDIALKKLSISIIIIYFLLILNFVISNYLNIGFDVYNKDGNFLNGNMYDNWNVYSYSLFFVPLVIYFVRISSRNLLYKYSIIVAIIINLILLVLSMKRTAIIGMAIGMLIFSIFYFNKKKVIKIILSIAVLLILFWPSFSSALRTRLEARKGKFEISIIDEELRYQETILVMKEIFDLSNIPRMLFGEQVFNSPGNYAYGKFGERPLHVDYNLILHGHGVVGLIIYILIFISIYKKFLFYWKYVPNNELTEILKILFYTLLFVPFITSFGGQITGITFRSLIFIGLGTIVGYARRFYIEYKHIELNVKFNSIQ